MSTATMVSPMELGLKTKSRKKLSPAIKQGNNLVIGDKEPEYVVMWIDEYKRYRYNERMEEYEREVEYTKKHWKFYDNVEDFMKSLDEE